MFDPNHYLGSPSSSLPQPEPPTHPLTMLGPNYQSSHSDVLGRAILNDQLPHTWEPRWWQITPSYKLPSLMGGEASRRAAAAEYQRGGSQPAYTPPGFPTRIQVGLPWSTPDNSLEGALGPGSAIGAGLGLAGGDTRGGALPGTPIATAPITLANFSAWGREGVLAAITLALSGGQGAYQTPAGATFGMDNKGPENHGLVDDLIGAIKVPFDIIGGAFDGANQWYNDYNASQRAEAVRALAQSGSVGAAASPIDWITTMITSPLLGNTQKFSAEEMLAQAEQKGVNYQQVVSDYWDLSPEVVGAIFANPNISDAALSELAKGQPLSRNPAVNLALEFTKQMAMFMAPIGLARYAGLIGKGISALDFAPGFSRGLTVGERVYQGAQEATSLQKGAQLAGYVTRRALQANSINTAAGWTIRGMEWSLKQAGLIFGNQQLVDLMDRAMWEMPLSMDPGVQIMTAFSSHPLEAIGVDVGHAGLIGRSETGLLRGRAMIGKRGTAGYVGTLDLRAGAFVDRPIISLPGAKSSNRLVMVGDRLVRLNDEGEQLVHAIETQGLDDWQPMFDRLGWDRHWIDTAFGPGNVDNLSLNDVRESLLYIALSAVRAQKGDAAAFSGLALPTLTERSVDFMARNIGGAHRLLQESISGASDALVNEIKGQWWRFADLNDTKQAAIKARLAQEWNAGTAGLGFRDFLSWVKASKLVRDAYAEGWIGADTSLKLRSDVNLEWLQQYKASLDKRFEADAIVPTVELDAVKRYGGKVETRGLGRRLVRVGRQEYKPKTRAQVDEILDSIIADEQAAREAAAAPPRESAAAFGHGVDPNTPLEQQRVLRISGRSLEVVREAEALPPDKLPDMAIPKDVLARTAAFAKMTPEQLLADPAAGWQKVFDWLDSVTQEATDTAHMRDVIDSFAPVLKERRASDPGVYDPAAEAAQITRDYVLNPIERSYIKPGNPRYRNLLETGQALRALLPDLEKLTKDPIRTAEVLDYGERGMFGWPRDIPQALATELLDLIGNVGDRVPDGDLAVLNDPALHPLLKLDILRKAELAPDELKVLQQLEAPEYQGALERLVQTMFGPDTQLDGQSAARLVVARHAWEASVEDAAAQLRAIGGRYQMLEAGASHSPEVLNMYDRLDEWAQTNQQTWQSEPVVRQEQVPLEETPFSKQRVAVQGRIRRAQGDIAQAEADMNLLRERNLEPSFDFTKPAWKRVRGKKGAVALAKEVNTETGAPTTFRKANGGYYDVYIGELKPRTQAIEDAYRAGEIARAQEMNVAEGVQGGGTPESGGAMAESGAARTQGGAVNLDEMRAQEAAAAQPEAPTAAPEAPQPAAPEQPVWGYFSGGNKEPRASFDDLLNDVGTVEVWREGDKTLYLSLDAEGNNVIKQLYEPVEPQRNELGKGWNARGYEGQVLPFTTKAEAQRWYREQMSWYQKVLPEGRVQTELRKPLPTQWDRPFPMEADAGRGAELLRRWREDNARFFDQPEQDLADAAKYLWTRDTREAVDLLRTIEQKRAEARQPAPAPEAAATPEKLAAIEARLADNPDVSSPPTQPTEAPPPPSDVLTPELLDWWRSLPPTDYRIGWYKDRALPRLAREAQDAINTEMTSNRDPAWEPWKSMTSWAAAHIQHSTDYVKEQLAQRRPYLTPEQIKTVEGWIREANAAKKKGNEEQAATLFDANYEDSLTARVHRAEEAAATDYARRLLESGMPLAEVQGRAGPKYIVRALDEVAGEPAAPTPPTPTGTYGTPTEFPLPGSEATKVQARFRLMELDQLRTDSDPGYRTELQPRQREGNVMSEEQIQKIKTEFDPDLALRTESGSHGPAVIDPSGDIVAGNGRTRAMRDMTDAQYAPYAEALAKRAGEFGLARDQVESMQRPVLVREVPTEAATHELALALNAETGRMTLPEMARAMADEMRPEDMDLLELGDSGTLAGSINAPRNKPFVDRLLARIPATKAAEYRDKGGAINPEGIRLIEAAVVQKVLHDPTGEVVDAIVGGAGEFGRLKGGLLDSIGQLARVEAAHAKGELADSLADPLRNAILEYRGYAELGLDPTAYQPESISWGHPLAADLGWALYQMGSRQEIASFFRKFAAAMLEKRVGEAPPGVEGMFFEGPAPLVDDPLRRSAQEAITELNNARREKAGLFGTEDTAYRVTVKDQPSRTQVFNERAGADAYARQLKAEGLKPRVLRPKASEITQLRDADGTRPARFETTAGQQSIAHDIPVMSTPEAAIDARMGPVERLLVRGNPLDPATYAGAEKAGEVVFHGEPENYARAVQAFYDDAGAAIGGYDTIARAGGDPEALFSLAAERINAGKPHSIDLLILDTLSADGLRFDEAGNFVGQFNPAATFEAGRHEALKLPLSRDPRVGAPGRQWRATHEPFEATPNDAAVLDSSAKDVGPFARGSGVEPDLTPERATVENVVEQGAHTFVKRGGPLDDAARNKIGASKGNDGVLEINRPDEALMMQRAQARLDASRQQLAEAQAEADALGPGRQAGPPDTPPIPPDIYELLLDYTAEPKVARDQGPMRGAMAELPVNLGEVADVIESLDAGVPALGRPMPEADLVRLRDGLMEWMQARLDAQGAPKVKHRTGPPKPEETMLLAPDLWRQELRNAFHELESIVKDDSTPITGYEGIQYDLGKMPKKGPQGEPLPPRVLATKSLLNMLEKVQPDLPDELLMGRKQNILHRQISARLNPIIGGLSDTFIGRGARWIARQIGPNPERDLRAATIDRFIDNVVGRVEDFGNLDEYMRAREEAAGIIGGLHKEMRQPEHVFARRFRIYRKEYTLGANRFDRVARETLAGGLKDPKLENLPDWAQGFIINNGGWEATPFFDAFAHADNRIRSYFAENPNGASKYVEAIYGSNMARRGSRQMAGVTMAYHTIRFLGDGRWIALEVVEAPTLTLFREGPSALMDALGVKFEGLRPKRGGIAKPLFVGLDDLSKMRQDFAWWAAADQIGGGITRYRENYLLALVRRQQLRDFPDELMAMAKRDPELAQTLAVMGDTPRQWLEKLNDSWELYSAMSRKISEPEARAVFGPRLEKGIINQSEFDSILAAVRSDQGFQYTQIPALEREVAAAIGHPALEPVMQRLQFLTEQAWNDAAQLIYGQVDRSNVQRLLNHPLLFWPISYQIKATKWLMGLMFDRFFGVDTGSLGALTLDRIHDQHQRAMAEDPAYRQFFRDNATLLFTASMFFPITPWDIGVGLSPFTRLAIGTAAGALGLPEDSPYRRNIFAFGPGYTYFNLGPRLAYELSKSPFGPARFIGETVGRNMPPTFQINPSSSQQAQITQQQIGSLPLPELPPFEKPPNRFGP